MPVDGPSPQAHRRRPRLSPRLARRRSSRSRLQAVQGHSQSPGLRESMLAGPSRAVAYQRPSRGTRTDLRHPTTARKMDAVHDTPVVAGSSDPSRSPMGRSVVPPGDRPVPVFTRRPRGDGPQNGARHDTAVAAGSTHPTCVPRMGRPVAFPPATGRFPSSLGATLSSGSQARFRFRRDRCPRDSHDHED